MIVGRITIGGGGAQFNDQGDIGIKGHQNGDKERHNEQSGLATTTIHGNATFTIVQ